MSKTMEKETSEVHRHENLFLRMLRGVRVLLCFAQGKIPDPQECFEALYGMKKDPWKYETSGYEREKYETTLGILKGKRFARALEIGCAEGVFTGMIAEVADAVVAVDVSPTALERASERNRENEHVEFVLLDVGKDNLPGTFDLIICSEVLYYLHEHERIEKAVEKFLTHLTADGFLLLTHMRLKADDDDGFESTKFGYPAFGGRTVHDIVRRNRDLETLDEVVRPKYRVMLFRKRQADSPAESTDEPV